MLRYVLPVLAALVLVTASLIPEDAFARRGGGGGYRGGGGFHGGAARVGGVHRGGVYAGRVGGGYRVPDIQLLVVPVVRATQSRAEGIIADTDTARRRWGPQRLVPRPTAPTALTTTATTRTATISAPASIDTDTRRAHADGGWVSSYRRPFLLCLPPGFYFQSSLICVNTFGRLSISL